MLKNVVIGILLLLCLWFWSGNYLKTFDGCVDSYFREFTGIEDRTRRRSRAIEVCEELVAEGRVLPPGN